MPFARSYRHICWDGDQYVPVYPYVLSYSSNRSVPAGYTCIYTLSELPTICQQVSLQGVPQFLILDRCMQMLLVYRPERSEPQIGMVVKREEIRLLSNLGLSHRDNLQDSPRRLPDGIVDFLPGRNRRVPSGPAPGKSPLLLLPLSPQRAAPVN